MSETDNEVSMVDAVSEAFSELDSTPSETVETPETPAIEDSVEITEKSIEDDLASDEVAEESEAPEGDETTQDSDEQAAKAPASWNAEMKEKFSKLPPDMQEYFLQRESERDAFAEQKSQESNRYKQQNDLIESSFDSVRHVMQQTGLSTAQAVQELVSLWKFGEQDPVAYANYYLKSKGIDLQQLAQGNIDPVQYQQRQLTSKISALESQIQSLTQKNSVEQDQILLSEIQNFASQPENKYFEEVRRKMQILFEARRVDSIDQAYKMACRMNPEVSELIEQEKAQERAKNTNAKAQAAKAASGVRLKSKEVSSVSKPTAQTDNMEDAVRAVFEELTGGVAA